MFIIFFHKKVPFVLILPLTDLHLFKSNTISLKKDRTGGIGLMA